MLFYGAFKNVTNLLRECQLHLGFKLIKENITFTCMYTLNAPNYEAPYI